MKWAKIIALESSSHPNMLRSHQIQKKAASSSLLKSGEKREDTVCIELLGIVIRWVKIVFGLSDVKTMPKKLKKPRRCGSSKL